MDTMWHEDLRVVHDSARVGMEARRLSEDMGGSFDGVGESPHTNIVQRGNLGSIATDMDFSSDITRIYKGDSAKVSHA